jgi:hypothetical protein
MLGSRTSSAKGLLQRTRKLASPSASAATHCGSAWLAAAMRFETPCGAPFCSASIS